MITILFGEMGAGKNYLGAHLAAQLGVPFVDGDTYLPPQLIEKLNGGGMLSTTEVDQFYWHSLLPGIRRAHFLYPRGFVLAQALYNDAHRRDLNAKFPIDWVWVKPTLPRHFKNLCCRPRAARWVLHTVLSKPWFQKPTVPHTVLKNGWKNELLVQ